MGITDIPLDIQRIVTNLNDILYNAIPSLVMAETEEEYLEVQQEVLAELEAADEATAWAWYKEHFDAAREIVTPAFQEYLAYYESVAK